MKKRFRNCNHKTKIATVVLFKALYLKDHCTLYYKTEFKTNFIPKGSSNDLDREDGRQKEKLRKNVYMFSVDQLHIYFERDW